MTPMGGPQMKRKSQYLTVNVQLKHQPNIAVLLTDIFILTYKVSVHRQKKQKEKMFKIFHVER